MDNDDSNHWYNTRDYTVITQMLGNKNTTDSVPYQQ